MDSKRVFNLLIVCLLLFLIQCSFKSYDDELIKLSDVTYWAYNIVDVDTERQREQLVGSHFDMYVLDPVITIKGEKHFNIDKLIDDIKQYNLQTRGVEPVILAYIDIGQAESFRWYWEENWGVGNPSWIAGTDPDEWEDCYPVAYWDATWEDITIYGYKGMSHIQAILKSGFDGIYMDWVEAFDDENVINVARRNGIDTVESMFDFIEKIRDYAQIHSLYKNPNFLIIAQNASALYEENPYRYRYLIDAIACEAIWYDGDEGFDDWNNPRGYNVLTNSLYPGWTHEVLEDLEKIKKYMPVFCVEYAQDIGPDMFGTTAYGLAQSEGFICYCTRRSLKKLSKTPPPPGYAPLDY